MKKIIDISRRGKKIRVNITVDGELLDKAKTKLNLFGGKLSTLFNAYLDDFVKTMEQGASEGHEKLLKRLKELETRIEKLEKHN